MSAAMEALRLKGLAAAVKKASRHASEGLVAVQQVCVRGEVTVGRRAPLTYSPTHYRPPPAMLLSLRWTARCIGGRAACASLCPVRLAN